MEFKLIDYIISQQLVARSDVTIGIGDDAAITQMPNNQSLVTATDTLVASVHFSPETPARAIGYKSLAVNLSDLAAMGAEPTWASLAITLPCADNAWLQAFMSGFFELATQYNVQLIGGDTTQGPLSITVTAQGVIPPQQALTRSGAEVGDYIYTTGFLGDAGAALHHPHEDLLSQLYYPHPRVKEGLLLRGLANSAIDISDGLCADLEHIMTASQVGVEICVDDLPISQQLNDTVGYQQALSYALTAGDDYELCFTADKAIHQQIVDAIPTCTRIGRVVNKPILHLHDKDGLKYSLPDNKGYQHFS